MKALTIHPPWAGAIVQGLKPVENRSVLWSYRGPLAIHAGKQISLAGLQAVRELTGPDLPVDVRGAVIGVVDLVDGHRAVGDCCHPWGFPLGPNGRPVVHYLLANPRAVDPIPIRGRQGLWNLPAAVAAKLESE